MSDICCYILFSESLQKFYTGICQDSLASRIEKHNAHYYSSKNFTAKAKDWELFLRIDSQDLGHARRMELKIKAMQSAKYIRNLKKYPELVIKIFEETKST